jgi:molecular chaperone GrpE
MHNDTPDDAVDIDDVIYDETETSVEKVRDMRTKLKQCQTERQEFLDGWQRAKADLINAKKRSVDEQGSFLERMSTSFIEDLFPVLDSFDMAFKNKVAWEAAPEQWRKGVEYIYSQLTSVLESRGVVILNPIGAEFNHHEHHSLASIQTEDAAQDGKVLEVVRKGYKIGETIIRPADVKVGARA